MTDQLQKVDIKLYFPSATIISEQQYKEMAYKELTCTVEITPFGAIGSNKELLAQGVVRRMRVIIIQDRESLEWMTFKAKNRQAFTVLQKALMEAVMDALDMRTLNPNYNLIVPREILVEKFKTEYTS